MTNTITYEGRTFTLDEDYEHPGMDACSSWGLTTRASATSATSTVAGLSLPFDSFPLPEPETVTNRIQTMQASTFTLDEDYEHPNMGPSVRRAIHRQLRPLPRQARTALAPLRLIPAA